MRKTLVLFSVFSIVLPVSADWEYGHDYESGDYPTSLYLLTGGDPVGYGAVWERTPIETDGTVLIQAFLKNNDVEGYEVVFFTLELSESGFPDNPTILPPGEDNYYSFTTVPLSKTGDPGDGDTYTWLPEDGVELAVPSHGRVAVGVGMEFQGQRVDLKCIHPDASDRSAYWKDEMVWMIMGDFSSDPDFCIRWTDESPAVVEVSWGEIKATY